MKTAMQELMGYIDSAWYDGHPPFTRYELETLIESFYSAEKRQIIDAYNDGIENHENASIKETAEQYYAKNYAS